MTKYHINKHTGRVGICKAQKSCPFGDLEKDHFNSRVDANRHYGKLMQREIFNQPSPYRSLKTMEANDLATELIDRVEKNGMNVEQFSDVLELSSILHARQVRERRGNKVNTPYIEHPLRTTLRLMRLRVKDEDVLKAALLHDTVEDCAKDFTQKFQNSENNENLARAKLLSYISQNYSQKTSAIVASVTNDYVSPENSKKTSKEEKIRIYKEHLEKEIIDNHEAFLVKISDYIDNAGSLKSQDLPGNEEKTKKRADKYLACVNIFKKELKKNSYLDEEAKKHLELQLKVIESSLQKISLKYSSL